MNAKALITGGSSGLGFELAKFLIKQNIDVCIVGRDQAKLDKAKAELEKSGDKAKLLPCRANIGNETEVTNLFSFMTENGFQPSLVFNNAGVGRFGDPAEISSKTIEDAFEANLIGLILVSTYALRNFPSDTGGIIVNIMSTASLVGRAKESVYCAAKWGARGFTEALKAATKGSNIKVIAVYPGGMNTPFWSEECGLSPNVEKFMSPSEVAQKLVKIILEIDSSVITDLTINRNESR